MEHVAGAQRVDGVHREGRRFLQLLLLVEPDRASAARACRPGTRASALRSSSAPGRRRRRRRSPAAARWRTPDATMPSASPPAATSRDRRRRSRECRAGAPRRTRSVQNSAQRLSVRMAAQSSSSVSVSGRCTFHSSGSRKVTMVRSPLGSIMMLEIGVTSPGMCTICLVSMPSCASFSKMKRLDVSRASPIGPQIEARPPSRTIPMAALSALPPQISSKWVAFSLEPRAGNAADAERQVAHRHADAQNARRDFRRGDMEIHAANPSCRLRICRNLGSGVNRLNHGRVPAMRANSGPACSQRPSK